MGGVICNMSWERLLARPKRFKLSAFCFLSVIVDRLVADFTTLDFVQI